jgi:hypothetical protein
VEVMAGEIQTEALPSNFLSVKVKRRIAIMRCIVICRFQEAETGDI